jgi:tRNA(fMet)-specific endonuclease VapC
MAARYLIDTDIFIYVRQRNPVKTHARFAAQQADAMAISTITYGELDYGARKSANPGAALAVLAGILHLLHVLPLTPRVGEVYGKLRASLAASGLIIGPNDLWIAAHALAENLILVTNNEREFKRVKGLKVENWAR